MKDPKMKLRPLEPEDLDELYVIENDPSIWNVGQTNVPYSRYILHDYISNQQADIYADRQVRLVIEDSECHVVGMIDLVNFDPRHQRAELSIVVKQAYRHRGYGRAAVKCIMEYARDMLHLHQVYIVVDVYNEEAIKLFSQMGFTGETQLSGWLFDGKEYREALLMQSFL